MVDTEDGHRALRAYPHRSYPKTRGRRLVPSPGNGPIRLIAIGSDERAVSRKCRVEENSDIALSPSGAGGGRASAGCRRQGKMRGAAQKEGPPRAPQKRRGGTRVSDAAAAGVNGRIGRGRSRQRQIRLRIGVLLVIGRQDHQPPIAR